MTDKDDNIMNFVKTLRKEKRFKMKKKNFQKQKRKTITASSYQ